MFVWIWMILLCRSTVSEGNFDTKLEPGHVKQDYETIEEVRSHINETVTEQIVANDQDLDERILDVAYYLRRFKFNGYDPRFPRESKNQERGFFTGFPSPPLKSIHWEVKKNCESSFEDCMKYLQKQVNRMILPRQLDSLTVTKQNGWSLPNDKEAIKKSNNECLALLERDERNFAQFSGPVQKFQWLTSASYYACLYTLKENSHLKFFSEDCDNFASCLNCDLEPKNGDIRSDNVHPFACALYSFCPDPCCPLKNLTDPSDCFDIGSCSKSTGSDRTCWFPAENNVNLGDLIQNRWNVSCTCDGMGMRWDSKSGICVDVDECVESEALCDVHSETCKNLPGTYKCICNPIGYQNNPETNKCERDPLMLRVFNPIPPLRQNESRSLTDRITSVLGNLAYSVRRYFDFQTNSSYSAQ